jgi:hypothetical protein
VPEMWEEKKRGQPLELVGEEEFGPQPLPKISAPVNYGVRYGHLEVWEEGRAARRWEGD